VRFWDASALVPQFLEEPTSKLVELWIIEDPDIAVWMMTRVEILATISRRRREGPRRLAIFSKAQTDVMEWSAMWQEVTQVDAVRQQAEAVLQRHALRAADALQLGAALLAADGDPASLDFVTFDNGLADAARREGFTVLRGRG
jgi:predicted nucleic acid-binding protein